MLRKVLQPFYTAYVSLTFIAGFLLCFPFIVLISLPRSAASRRALYVLVKYFTKSWLWIIGMPAKICGPLPPPGRYVAVANHISYLDTVLIFAGLPFYFHALGKKEMGSIPLFGYLYRQIVVMVDRENDKSRAASMRHMEYTLKNESSILIFPEGTFNETEALLKDFYSGAFRLAANTGTPVLPVLFPDTVHRWHYSAWWKMWPGRNRVIFLPLIAPAGDTHNDAEVLKQHVYAAMERGLLRCVKG